MRTRRGVETQTAGAVPVLVTVPSLGETCGGCAHLDHYGPPRLRTWFCRRNPPDRIQRDDPACAQWTPAPGRAA
jgi:hypothetical protein